MITQIKRLARALIAVTSFYRHYFLYIGQIPPFHQLKSIYTRALAHTYLHIATVGGLGHPIRIKRVVHIHIVAEKKNDLYHFHRHRPSLRNDKSERPKNTNTKFYAPPVVPVCLCALFGLRYTYVQCVRLIGVL